MWSILISLLLLTPISVVAHPKQFLEDAASRDEPELQSFKPLETEDLFIEDQQVPFTRHRKIEEETITNEIQIYILQISAFNITLEPTPDEFTLEKKVLLDNLVESTLLKNIPKKGGITFSQLKMLTLNTSDVEWQPARRMRRNGRYLEGGESTVPKTLVYVPGGEAVFQTSINIDSPSSDQLDQVAIQVLNSDLLDELKPDFEFITTATAVPASDGDEDTEEEDSTDEDTEEENELDNENEHNGAKGQDDTIPEEKDLIRTSNAGAVSAGVLGALAAIAVGALVVAKKKGYPFPFQGARKKRGPLYKDAGDLNEEYAETPKTERSMKRDYNFEEYMVECCTDNDFDPRFQESPTTPIISPNRRDRKEMSRETSEYVIECCTDADH